MPAFKQPETYLRIWERERLNDPSLTLERFAMSQCIPLKALKARLDTAYRVRELLLGRVPVVQTGAVTTMEFEAGVGFDKWFLLQSDNHHDSILCNRELERRHLVEAVERDAAVFIFGDLFDAMQGRFDPRRSMMELRPEYRSDKYYDVVIEDTAKFFLPYAHHMAVVTDGNHELSILKNSNTDVMGRFIREMNLVGGKVLRGGYGGWVHLVFDLGEGRRVVKQIKYFHGSGGEAPVTRGVIQTNRQAVYLPDADVVVNEHSHNAYYIPICRERLTAAGEHLFDIQHHIRIPGYKQGYGDGMGGWEVTRGGVPKPIGAVWLQFVREGDEIDVRVMMALRPSEPVSIDPQELYTGRVYAQDGEGV